MQIHFFKKLKCSETIADGFQDCILANLFCFFCCFSVLWTTVVTNISYLTLSTLNLLQNIILGFFFFNNLR